MTITKKHFTAMAIRLGGLRFKYKGKTSVSTADLIMDYENMIHEFFNLSSTYYNDDKFFDAISERFRDLVNLENEERIKKHDKAVQDISNNFFDFNIHK